MKNYHLIKFAVLFFVCCAMLGCIKIDVEGVDNAENPTNGNGSIYGTVTEYATGELLGNVNVCLSPSGTTGENVLTGSDGFFQFEKLSENYYELTATKYGYEDYEVYNIFIEADKNVHWEIQLHKKLH